MTGVRDLQNTVVAGQDLRLGLRRLTMEATDGLLVHVRHPEDLPERKGFDNLMRVREPSITQFST